MSRGLRALVGRPPSAVGQAFAGRIATLNGMGFMESQLNEVSEQFVADCCGVHGRVLDVGCAYGVAALAALKVGAHVVACDPDQRHLDAVADRAPGPSRARLRTVLGSLPEIDFEDASFRAIHCSRCLHFLDPTDLRSAMKKMQRWLEPGGKAYFVATTCFGEPWNRCIEQYKEKKSSGHEWPGLIDSDGLLECLPDATPGRGMPSFMNTLDPATLRRECELAGFSPLESGFVRAPGYSLALYEHSGAIVMKERHAPGRIGSQRRSGPDMD